MQTTRTSHASMYARGWRAVNEVHTKPRTEKARAHGQRRYGLRCIRVAKHAERPVNAFAQTQCSPVCEHCAARRSRRKRNETKEKKNSGQQNIYIWNTDKYLI